LRSCFRKCFCSGGTIEGNIRLGREDIDEDRVRWAAQEVMQTVFIRRLKGEYEAEVRERGAGLSVGQKQLISFARALAFDPAILILMKRRARSIPRPSS
jgi:ATP-binding cassette subfamily B protein